MSSRNTLAVLAVIAASVALITAPAVADVSLHGRVHNLDGEPLQNVTIAAPALSLRTYSDEQGNFGFQLRPDLGEVVLVFDIPGFYPETVTYQPAEQPAELDIALTPRRMVKQQVNVVASRLDIPLSQIPAATSVVPPENFDTMPRGIGVEEALQSVPGIKIDNQADGERVHVSIRGQGILSEHGLRGIQVLLDGLPLNDPSGFAPDLYDVDWKDVQELQVIRGPMAVLYGGGSAGGVIDIRSDQPEQATHGGIWSTGGPNSFYKTHADVSGILPWVGYSFSASKTAGDGYRQHTSFWGDNLSARFNFKPTDKLQLNALFFGTGYFNQNAEGLNLTWLAQDPRMANPDALTYNEYQKTVRYTGGLTGNWEITGNQTLAFTFFTRHTQYDEPVPSSVLHRSMMYPGGSVQYHREDGEGFLKNYFSTGTDLDRQNIDEMIHPNLGHAVEGNQVLANQSITQNRAAWYAIDRLALGPQWTLFGSLRYERISNQLTDNLKAGGIDLSGDRIFTKATGRVGVSWTPRKEVSLYTAWGQGFLPPATEELGSNPAAFGGFNRSLVPATSQGEEAGVRGSLGNHFFYDTNFFHLSTDNDFERYRIQSRPLETFYGNAGQSSRYGVETSLRWLPMHRLTLSGAYTYSHFTYSKYQSLTYPGNLVGNFLPNSPAQQLSMDAMVDLPYKFFIDVNTMIYSRAYIDPTNTTWIDGYALMGARIAKGWQRKHYSGTVFVSGRNLTAKPYIAFTEPDPDGNSYQPGPLREVFGGMEFRF